MLGLGAGPWRIAATGMALATIPLGTQISALAQLTCLLAALVIYLVLERPTLARSHRRASVVVSARSQSWLPPCAAPLSTRGSRGQSPSARSSVSQRHPPVTVLGAETGRDLGPPRGRRTRPGVSPVRACRWSGSIAVSMDPSARTFGQGDGRRPPRSWSAGPGRRCDRGVYRSKRVLEAPTRRAVAAELPRRRVFAPVRVSSRRGNDGARTRGSSSTGAAVRRSSSRRRLAGERTLAVRRRGASARPPRSCPSPGRRRYPGAHGC